MSSPCAAVPPPFPEFGTLRDKRGDLDLMTGVEHHWWRAQPNPAQNFEQVFKSSAPGCVVPPVV
jgi:hypothetical protein